MSSVVKVAPHPITSDLMPVEVTDATKQLLKRPALTLNYVVVDSICRRSDKHPPSIKKSCKLVSNLTSRDGSEVSH